MKRTVDAPPELVTDTFVKLELQKLKCQINNVKGTVIDFEPFNDVPLCGQIKQIQNVPMYGQKQINQRIVVWKGWIIDGKNKCLLPIAQENLDLCCYDDEVFTCMVKAFTFVPGNKLQKTLTHKLH